MSGRIVNYGCLILLGTTMLLAQGPDVAEDPDSTEGIDRGMLATASLGYSKGFEHLILIPFNTIGFSLGTYGRTVDISAHLYLGQNEGVVDELPNVRRTWLDSPNVFSLEVGRTRRMGMYWVAVSAGPAYVAIEERLDTWGIVDVQRLCPLFSCFDREIYGWLEGRKRTPSSLGVVFRGMFGMESGRQFTSGIEFSYVTSEAWSGLSVWLKGGFALQ